MRSMACNLLKISIRFPFGTSSSITSFEAVKWALKAEMSEQMRSDAVVGIPRAWILAKGGSGVAFLGRGNSIGIEL